MRTLTPLRFDPDQLHLDVEIVLHDGGPLSDWAAGARPGAPTAVSGTGRGYTIDPAVRSYVLGGDESALPAISTLLAALPSEASVTVLVEVAHPDAQVDLPAHPGATVRWLAQPPTRRPARRWSPPYGTPTSHPTAHVWAAGEAASMQRIRKHLADDRDHPRAQCTVRGYWKHGRAATDDDN